MSKSPSSPVVATGTLGVRDKMKLLLARKVEINPHAQLLTPGEVQTAVTSMAQHPPAPSPAPEAEKKQSTPTPLPSPLKEHKKGAEEEDDLNHLLDHLDDQHDKEKEEEDDISRLLAQPDGKDKEDEDEMELDEEEEDEEEKEESPKKPKKRPSAFILDQAEAADEEDEPEEGMSKKEAEQERKKQLAFTARDESVEEELDTSAKVSKKRGGLRPVLPGDREREEREEEEARALAERYKKKEQVGFSTLRKTFKMRGVGKIVEKKKAASSAGEEDPERALLEEEAEREREKDAILGGDEDEEEDEEMEERDQLPQTVRDDDEEPPADLDSAAPSDEEEEGGDKDEKEEADATHSSKARVVINPQDYAAINPSDEEEEEEEETPPPAKEEKEKEEKPAKSVEAIADARKAVIERDAVVQKIVARTLERLEKLTSTMKAGEKAFFRAPGQAADEGMKDLLTRYVEAIYQAVLDGEVDLLGTSTRGREKIEVAIDLVAPFRQALLKHQETVLGITTAVFETPDDEAATRKRIKALSHKQRAALLLLVGFEMFHIDVMRDLKAARPLRCAISQQSIKKGDPMHLLMLLYKPESEEEKKNAKVYYFPIATQISAKKSLVAAAEPPKQSKETSKKTAPQIVLDAASPQKERVVHFKEEKTIIPTKKQPAAAPAVEEDAMDLDEPPKTPDVPFILSQETTPVSPVKGKGKPSAPLARAEEEKEEEKEADFGSLLVEPTLLQRLHHGEKAVVLRNPDHLLYWKRAVDFYKGSGNQLIEIGWRHQAEQDPVVFFDQFYRPKVADPNKPWPKMACEQLFQALFDIIPHPKTAAFLESGHKEQEFSLLLPPIGTLEKIQVYYRTDADFSAESLREVKALMAHFNPDLFAFLLGVAFDKGCVVHSEEEIAKNPAVQLMTKNIASNSPEGQKLYAIPQQANQPKLSPEAASGTARRRFYTRLLCQLFGIDVPKIVEFSGPRPTY